MNSATVSLSLSSFSTNENKALLWSVLHGSGKFVGIPDSQQQTIQEMFDSTIREMSEHYRKSNQPINLNAINKEAVVVICNKIEAVKQRQQPPYNNRHIPQQQQIYQKKQQQVPQLETIYRAEDLHKERQNAFQNEFKKKEEEMSSILKLKKPEEINFTDDVYDKPIGNDMERLLAEALASRERELEQIKNTAFTAPQPQPQTDSKGSAGPSPTSQEFMTYKTVVREKEIEGEKERNIKENEKRVSFGSELHIIENNENNQNDYERGESNNENVDENSDISFIFNKLKKIKTKKNEEHENEEDMHNMYNNNNNVDENNNTHTIFKMSQDIDKISEDINYIKNTLAELSDKINKLCDHENS